MNITRKFLLAAAALVAVIAVSAPATAVAATSPWTWTDVSSQVSVRRNRPVWAMAYMKPYWYFTDGQAFAKTGRVWRTDGWTSKDITKDVKNAGLSRVDAIVSDGAAVFFTGPEGTRAFDGATFSTRAADATPDYSDGVNIFFREDGIARTVAVPAELASLDWKHSKIAWTGGSWMIVAGKTLVRYDGVNFQNLGQTRDVITTIASDGNGTTLLGGAVSKDTLANPSLPLTAKLSKVVEEKAPAFWTWANTRAPLALRSDETTTYNVGAWHAKGVKKIEIFLNGVSKKTCDFTDSGNQTCTLALSGSDYKTNATLALNATITSASGKTMRTDSRALTVTPAPLATFAVSTAPSAPAVLAASPATNPNVSTWTWIEPNLSGIDYRESVVFKGQANTTAGLNRIDLYVNGALRRMCDFARAYGTQTCDLTVNAIDYPVGTNLTLAAKATAASGDVVWSPARTITVRDNVKDAGTTPATIKTWMSPAVDSVKGTDVVTYFAQAQDVDGIAKIELLSDKAVAQTCSFSNTYSPVECSLPVSAQLFPNSAMANATARVTDAKGNVTLSDTRYFNLTK